MYLKDNLLASGGAEHGAAKAAVVQVLVVLP